MLLSKKQNTSSHLFADFQKSRLNLEHLKKDDPYSLCISEITDWERRGLTNA